MVSPERVPVYQYTGGWLNSFFVEGYVRRTILAGNVALTPIEEAAMQAFIAFSNHPDLVLRMLLEPGDMQFLNNRTLFHGRAAFEDHPEKPRRRHLLRLWLTVPDWPRMAPAQDYHGAEVRRRWADHAAAKALKSAGQSSPVHVRGFEGVPAAGDPFIAMTDAVEARDIAQKRQRLEREAQNRRSARGGTLEDISRALKEGAVSQLRIIIKADQGGPAEALADSLAQLGTNEVREIGRAHV